jgi:NAD(P)-dependent dehydrogenase (short-subunit alcohol dehydrogenase family)
MDGRTCLIVGGTSGIGLAATRRFVQEGARVVAAGRLPGTALPGPERPGPVWEYALELADGEAEVVRMFAFARDVLGGRIDILLHVAGISGRKFGDGPLHECTTEGWGHVMQVNAFGVFLTNREAVRQMLGQPIDGTGLRGTVVNVGSVVDRSPSPLRFGTLAYAASKGAVRALTRAAAARYAPDRIRFNLLAPGLIDTPMATRAVNDPRIRAYIAAKQPIACSPGTADDVAEAALYLCEPAARFVTGAELVVDGGWCVSEGAGEGEATREGEAAQEGKAIREGEAPAEPDIRRGDSLEGQPAAELHSSPARQEPIPSVGSTGGSPFPEPEGGGSPYPEPTPPS